MSFATYVVGPSAISADTQEPCCASCGSTALVKSGHNSARTQQFLCKLCGAHRVLKAKSRATDPELKAWVLQAVEVGGLSLREAERRFGVARQSIARWRKCVPIAELSKKDPVSRIYAPF